MTARALAVFAALAVCAALACARAPAPPARDQDGGEDAGTDGGSDAGSDGGSDAGSDGGSDAGPVPGAPSLRGTSQPGAASVALSWTAADALATSFQILRSTSGAPFAPLAQVPGSTLSYTDSSLTIGDPYAYEVTASDSAGPGAPSNEIDLLGSPFDVAAGGSDTRVLVTWSPTDDADSYSVYATAPSGAQLLLGTTTSSWFIDDGSQHALGASVPYTYQVVSSGAGFLSSIFSNGATAAALGLDVTANQIFVSDLGEESQSLAPGLLLEARNIDGGPLLDDAGAPVVYESLTAGNTIVVPGVPRGTYALTVEGYQDYAVGSARAVDFSQVTPGRSDVQAASPGTQIAYDLTDLAAWSAGADGGLADAIEEISLGAHDFSYDLADDVPAPPAAGATAFTGTETLGQDTDSNLISADAGDALYVFQLHAQASANGVPYLAPAGVLASQAFTTIDGATNPLAGALVAPSPIAIASFAFPRGAYLDPAHATQNPAATNAQQRVYLEQEKGFAAHGWYSNQSVADGLILAIPQDGGTAESDGGIAVDVGALTWAQPVPATWDSFVLIQSTYDVPFTITFQDDSTTPSQIDTAHATFTSYSSATVPMAGSTFAQSALAPTLSAPRAPQWNGASAFTAQTNISATSRLSWSAPALGAPGYYVVRIYEIVPQTLDDGTPVQDGEGDYLTTTSKVASFTTASQSVALAADLVHPGVSYFATIDAVMNAGAAGPIDGTVQPYALGPSYSAIETVTSLFTIAAPPPAQPRGHARRPADRRSRRRAIFR